ncbi:hypothetical protein KBB96_04860 [Luteolibacter ambystomatis]|uniref:Uncharacterized protein n=1 Tax=Luteolibacter ambystomatis TaxID=2824561 RepID=A0A975PFU1_9BACT|nr:hypothetical protein [Luteolibacter ambystomatis]QUE52223.1 hypothetical protein KBB96_04860 [Luteolibacter ambystomatis]
MKKLHLPFHFVLILALSGCAGTTFHRVTDDSKDEGLRYVETSTYLLVTTDNNGGVKSEILTLPDRSRLHSARPWALMSSNETTLTLSEGALAGTSSTLDTSKVPAAIADAVKTFGPLLVGANTKDGTPEASKSVPGPRLFKIMNTPKGIALVDAKVTYPLVQFEP